MAIRDDKTKFSDGQAISSATTTKSTYTLDLGAAGNLGASDVEIRVYAKFTSGSYLDETLQVKLKGDDSTSGGDVTANAKVIAETAAEDLDTDFYAVLRPSGIAEKRYYQLEYVTAGTWTSKAISVTAELVPAGSSRQDADAF